jgi:hypothetical protein
MGLYLQCDSGGNEPLCLPEIKLHLPLLFAKNGMVGFARIPYLQSKRLNGDYRIFAERRLSYHFPTWHTLYTVSYYRQIG